MKTVKLQVDVAEGKIAMDIGGNLISKEAVKPTGNSNAYSIVECETDHEMCRYQECVKLD